MTHNNTRRHALLACTLLSSLVTVDLDAASLTAGELGSLREIQLTERQKAALEKVRGQAFTACFYDPMGKQGPIYNYAKDYALEAMKYGITLKLEAYTDEKIAAEDFKAGRCDGVAISGLRARQFNHFTGSIDSVGGLTSYDEMRTLIATLAKPQLAPFMIQDNVEVAAVIPLGAAYIMVNDRRINTPEKASGKKVAVLDYDKSQAKMVAQMGASPVLSDITSAPGKFNNGAVDIIAAPAVAFRPLELYRGLGNQGAIVRFPLAQLSGQVLLRRDRIPPEAGELIREVVASKVDVAFAFIDRTEREIEARYWLEIPETDREKYRRMMRDARIALRQDGTYDPRMLKLLKKIRCKHNPQSFECTLGEE